MNSIKATIFLFLMLLLGPLTATIARADHGHYHGGYYYGPRVGFGVGLGVGLALDGWPGYYPYGYYPYGYYPYGYHPYGYYPYAAYPPVVVTQQAAPTVYIEQDNAVPAPEGQTQSAAPAPAQSSNDWYYCRKPAGYYPYVQKCPNGWQRVPSQPQTQN